MFYTYVLKNTLSGRHYIGSTNKLLRRIREHNRGQTKSTKVKGIWVLIYFEKFKTSKEANIREKKLKSYKGGNAFKKILQR